jgi:hypothetical protein
MRGGLAFRWQWVVFRGAERFSDREAGSIGSAGDEAGVALPGGREQGDCAAVLAGVEARG